MVRPRDHHHHRNQIGGDITLELAVCFTAAAHLCNLAFSHNAAVYAVRASLKLHSGNLRARAYRQRIIIYRDPEKSTSMPRYYVPLALLLNRLISKIGTLTWDEVKFVRRSLGNARNDAAELSTIGAAKSKLRVRFDLLFDNAFEYKIHKWPVCFIIYLPTHVTLSLQY